MAYTFKKNLVASSKHSIKCPYTRTPKYVVVHNTANDASAKNEVSYHNSNNNQVSYHIAVDDIEAIQCVDFGRNVWACGDGANGQGNRYGISVEICYSKSGGSKYTQAEENAVYVVARLLYQYNLGISALKQHADFANKNCPHRIRDEKRWGGFVGRVQWVLDEIKKGNVDKALASGTTSTKQPAPSTNTSTNTGSTSSSLTGSNFTVRIKCDELTIRQSASFTSKAVGVVKKGEVYTIVETSNGLGRLKSGAGWISMGTAYVEKTGTATATATAPKEYQVKITDTLNVRKGAGTSYGVVTTVRKGEVYTIVEEKSGWGKLKSGIGWISLAYTTKL